jgi:hypothetical protein
VVGNPPWKGRAGQVTSAQRWADEQSLPHPAKDIAWCFVWKALRVLKADGLVALLLPAMGILHNRESQDARRLLLRKARVRRIINLSDLCFQLFDGAQRPSAFALYQNAGEDDTPYRFEYWVPKADLNLRLKRMMTLARSDRVRLRSDLVDGDPSIFKRRLWTRSPDEKLLQYLHSIPKLQTFIHQYKNVRTTFVRDTTWAIGQGFQPADPKRIGKPGYRTTTSQSVTKYPYLDANTFAPFALPLINTPFWKTKTVRRAGFSPGFLGPHILVPQGVERHHPRVRAAYCEQDLVFEHSLQAIAFPPAKRKMAKLLTGILNSSLAAWFYFHETANFGTDRAKIHQQDLVLLPFAQSKDMPLPDRALAAGEKIVRLIDKELKVVNNLLHPQGDFFAEIDAMVFEYYGLDSHDIALVEDTFKYILPAMQPRRSAGLQPIWSNSRPEQRCAYASMLCDALKPLFSVPVSASLAARSTDIAVLRVTLDKQRTSPEYSEETSSDFVQFLNQVTASLPEPLPGNVLLTPDLRFVIGSDMYLVKPMQLRHWLRSSALADADQIAAEFSAVVARGNKSVVSNAHG